MTEDEMLYREAMRCIENLVEEVLERCDEVAAENHFDRDWVLDRFRERFMRAKRSSS